MHVVNPMQCGKKTRGGYPCRLPPMHGQVVCRMHGGSSPQALAKAEDRMRALVHPAISALQRLIDENDLGATKYVLDYAGFKAADKIQSEQDLHVTVLFDRADDDHLALPG